MPHYLLIAMNAWWWLSHITVPKVKAVTMGTAHNLLYYALKTMWCELFCLQKCYCSEATKHTQTIKRLGNVEAANCQHTHTQTHIHTHWEKTACLWCFCFFVFFFCFSIWLWRCDKSYIKTCLPHRTAVCWNHRWCTLSSLSWIYCLYLYHATKKTVANAGTTDPCSHLTSLQLHHSVIKERISMCKNLWQYFQPQSYTFLNSGL